MITASLAVAAPPNMVRTTAAVFTSNGNTAVTYASHSNNQAFQDGITTFNGWQYAVYWDQQNKVNVSRRQLPSGSWQHVTLMDYAKINTDSHNVISMAINPADGTIHLAFDMHNSQLRYRRSVPGLAANPGAFPWNAAQFGALQTSITPSDSPNLTYPQFINRPDGKLQLAIRTGGSGAGDEVLYEYSNGVWTYLGRFISGEGIRNAYLFGIEYQGSRLHTSWTWRETPDGSTNHDIMYAYSDDYGRTWKNSVGTSVAATGTTFMKQSTADIKVWSIGQNRGLMNQESQTVDSAGGVHVLASHLPVAAPDQSSFTAARNTAVLFHYYRNPTTGVWSQIPTSIREGMNRSQIGVDSSDNIYIVSPNSVTSDPAYHRLRIHAASAASGWHDLSLKYTSIASLADADLLIDEKRLAQSDILTLYYLTGDGSVIAYQDWNVNL